MIDAAKSLTSLTHNTPVIIEATEFFVRVVLEGITNNLGVVEALNTVSGLNHWKELKI